MPKTSRELIESLLKKNATDNEALLQLQIDGINNKIEKLQIQQENALINIEDKIAIRGWKNARRWRR